MATKLIALNSNYFLESPTPYLWRAEMNSPARAENSPPKFRVRDDSAAKMADKLASLSKV
jgi:hypothetical protein